MVNLDTLNFDSFTSSSRPYMTPPAERPDRAERTSQSSQSSGSDKSRHSYSTIDRPLVHTMSPYGRNPEHNVKTSADLAALFRAYIRALNMKSFSTLRLFLSSTCTCNGAKWNANIIQDMIAPVSTRHSTGTIVMLVADISQRVVATRLQLQYQSNANIIEFDNLFYRYNDQWMIEEIRGNLPWNERVDHTIQEKRNRRRARNLPSPQQSLSHFGTVSPPHTSPESSSSASLTPPPPP